MCYYSGIRLDFHYWAVAHFDPFFTMGLGTALFMVLRGIMVRPQIANNDLRSGAFIPLDFYLPP